MEISSCLVFLPRNANSAATRNSGVAITAKREMEIATAMAATSMITAERTGLAIAKAAPTRPTSEKNRADQPRPTIVPDPSASNAPP